MELPFSWRFFLSQQQAREGFQHCSLSRRTREKSTGSLCTGCDIGKRPRPVIVLRTGCFSTCPLLRQKNLSESRSLPSLTHTRTLKSISKKKKSTLTQPFSEVSSPFYSNIEKKKKLSCKCEKEDCSPSHILYANPGSQETGRNGKAREITPKSEHNKAFPTAETVCSFSFASNRFFTHPVTFYSR